MHLNLFVISTNSESSTYGWVFFMGRDLSLYFFRRLYIDVIRAGPCGNHFHSFIFSPCQHQGRFHANILFNNDVMGIRGSILSNRQHHRKADMTQPYMKRHKTGGQATIKHTQHPVFLFTLNKQLYGGWVEKKKQMVDYLYSPSKQNQLV